MPRRAHVLRLPSLAAALLVLAAPRAPVHAQGDDRPDLGGLTWSLGQPTRWRHHLAPTFGAHRRGASDSLSLLLRAGVERALLNPLIPGLLAARAEGYAGARTAKLDGGVRAQLVVPLLGIGGGIDWNARDRTTDALWSLAVALRRGGVLGGGTRLQVDWLPGRGNTFLFGVHVPLDPHAGRTRPRADAVRLPPDRARPRDRAALPAAATRALVEARAAAAAIGRLVTPMLDGAPQDPDAAVAPVVGEVRGRTGAAGGKRTLEGEVRALHAATTAAFAAVAGDTAEGARLAALARAALLEHVLLPYDALLGRRRTPDTIAPLAATASAEFTRALLAAGVAPRVLGGAEAVLAALLEAVEAVRAERRAAWGDERMVWLPLQLALLPEDHDTQAEVDALVERALRRPFSRGNRLWWVINEQFTIELARQLHLARRHHVLWVHDFAGRSAADPDTVSWLVTTRGYLAALLARVREYDARGTLPSFHVVIDQHFYEITGGRLWLTLLERPLDHRLELGAAHAGMARTVAAYQDSLRTAVAASPLLQARRRAYGDAWLRTLVRVHVHVTNPSDFSFWSPDVVPGLGLPDNSLRDHRKLAFRDVGEDDPWGGSVLLTGMGVGASYAGPGWEDRALLVEGPATLAFRDALVQLLREQGARAAQVPWALRPQPGAPPAVLDSVLAEFAADRRADARILTAQNGTGLLEKDATVLKALLYTLAPAGSVIKLPDSIWQSPLLGAFAAGAALRGCRVLVIAPSLAAAPSAGWPQMAGAWTILARLVALHGALGPELAAARGLLRVGFYDTRTGVGDLAGRAHERAARAAATPWLREVLPLDTAVLAAWRGATDGASRYLATGDTSTPAKLHLKGHLVATREGWDALLARPEWRDLERSWFEARREQVERPAGPVDVKRLPARTARAAEAVVGAFLAATDSATRARIGYWVAVGSANQDNRSLVENGETVTLVAGWAGLAAAVDFVHLAAGARWVDDVAALERLLPRPSGPRYRLARLVRIAL